MTPDEKRFIKFVQDTRPKSVEDIRDWHPRFLGKGAFREAFLVRTGARKKPLGLVIKFPCDGGFKSKAKKKWAIADGIRHSREEVQAVRRMRKDAKLRVLRRYAPVILFHEPGTGVIIMPLYKPIRYKNSFYGFAQTFECMLADLIPEMRYEFDNGIRNFGLNEEDCYVLLDAGLVGAVKGKR